MKSNLPLRLFLSLLFFVPLLISGQTLSIPKTVFAPGEKIPVSFSGFSGAANDWISIATKDMAEDKYIIWAYTGGGSSGTVTLDGRPSGEYELRGYFNNESKVRTRISFRIGNVDQTLTVKTDKATYKPWEPITITFSGLPGNAKDWISYGVVGTPDDKYYRWAYTDGKQSGSLKLDGAEEGKYEVRVFINNDSKTQIRYPFTVCTSCGAGKKACRTELSTFYQSMNSLGLCWGRLGSDAFTATTIAAVQTQLGNVPVGITSIGCLDFDVNKITSYSSRLPGMTQASAVSEIDALIKEIQASVMRARVTCDRGALLESLFSAGIHLGAAQGIANSFVCQTIPPPWQTNLRNHLGLVSSGISGFGPCLTGVNSATASTVPVGAPNAYEALSVIIGLHMQVLWAVSLTECCCTCP
ncbi:MAG: hypothetical protein IPL92_18015 [Saprospiraceae bacterium]|nr:hypothetical protein [Candidatus Opimibacter iunctus]